MPEKLTLSIDETAKQLSVSRRMVYLLINRGALPSIRVGRRRLVTRAALDEYLDSLSDGAAS